jgi:hypothetical protein
MARPRIFISSTFYDLRQIREDLERTVKDLGYEPIRHETGAIAYSKDEKLESAAYREVDLCDVLVSIIGGRYGSDSAVAPGASISQTELRRALERGVQVFIFIEKSVNAEYSTYKLNKELAGVKYGSVDNAKIFEFIDELNKLPQNNAIAQFEVAQDISSYLRDQFAGLFHQFLQDRKRAVEMRVLEEMNATARTLKEVVTFLTEERNKGTADAIQSILLVNHPAFPAFAQLTGTKYRVFFSNREELNTWLEEIGWEVGDGQEFDPDSIAEWVNGTVRAYLKLTHEIFDEKGTLMNVQPSEWRNEWLQKVNFPPRNRANRRAHHSDDDIPS